MAWITIKLMEYQLKKAKKQHENEEHSIFKRAISDMVESYKTAIIFLKANTNN